MGQAAQSFEQIRQGVDIFGSGPSVSVKQFLALNVRDHGHCFIVRERCHAQGGVLDEFHENAAQAEHQSRTESWLGTDPDQGLNRITCDHGLEKETFDFHSGMMCFQASLKKLVCVFQFFFGMEIELDQSGFTLVGYFSGCHLEHQGPSKFLGRFLYLAPALA